MDGVHSRNLLQATRYVEELHMFYRQNKQWLLTRTCMDIGTPLRSNFLAKAAKAIIRCFFTSMTNRQISPSPKKLFSEGSWI
ncbi:unnamed protein product [Urochloa humidicola]